MTTPTITREQIVAMPAGPELDALVAGKVMGEAASFGLAPYHTWDGMHWFPHDDRQQCTRCGSWEGWESECLLSPPQYSSDIPAAWLVVEKMRKREWAVRIEDHKHWAIRPYDGYGTEFQSRHEPFHAFALAEALPLAICRAALLATLGADEGVKYGEPDSALAQR